MKFVGITRGGSEGIIAVLEDGDQRLYYESVAISSLLKTASADDKFELEKAREAIANVTSFDDVPEFESSIPQQPSLFR